jgi:hypothetical protein
VAELVDAQVSEACCRKAVEVRFFSSAPTHQIILTVQIRIPLEMHPAPSFISAF